MYVYLFMVYLTTLSVAQTYRATATNMNRKGYRRKRWWHYLNDYPSIWLEEQESHQVSIHRSEIWTQGLPFTKY
jgi:hypothetical protein